MKTSFQLVRFAFIGALNTIIHYLIFILLFRALGFAMITASVIGYFSGMINSFILNRRWTFQLSGPGYGSEFIKFAAVNIVSLGINILFLQMLVSFFDILPEISQVMAIIVALSVNFSGNKYWTFQHKSPRRGDL
ncbi:GtrA family protein [Desulfosediminicola sp.]|uniref:GtrA family protein n=1 Tax=Desulfosediminicola sp. TaxID=2886825 RepID=UPI003AF2B4B5